MRAWLKRRFSYQRVDHPEWHVLKWTVSWNLWGKRMALSRIRPHK